VLGKRYAQPFGIAPTGMNAMIWPGGDQFMAAAARDMDIPLVNSTMASASVEQVAAIAPGNIWFQLYTFTDEKVNADIIARSEAAGVDVFVIPRPIATATPATVSAAPSTLTPPKRCKWRCARIGCGPRCAPVNPRRSISALMATPIAGCASVSPWAS
jgi:hypothetical protein